MDYTAFIISLEQHIHKMALRYRGYADVEDLEQEVKLAIWQTWERVCTAENPVTYAIGIARKVFLRIASHKKSVSAESLEKYLTWYNSDGETYYRDIAIPENPKQLASKAMRRRILAALDTLPTRQRQSIMAFYRIENRSGYVANKDKSLDSSRAPGMRKLRRLL